MGKYKIKTHQATKKRFRKTGSGKILRAKGHQGHLRRRKSDRSKRQMKKINHLCELSASSEAGGEKLREASNCTHYALRSSIKNLKTPLHPL